jgi:catechol 2,3-dioxygenase-like lactoylglutathione lyase family enzyme
MNKHPDYTFAHAGLNVASPKKAAEWYEQHLSMRIVRSSPPKAYFLADPTGRVILEIYENREEVTLPFREIRPMTFHLAFLVENVRKEMERLISAGCTVSDEYKETPAGDTMVILRDPFDLHIQLIRRSQPMF